MPERAHIAVGSNMGDRYAHLEAGLAEINAFPDTRIVTTSSIYETLPIGPQQPDYLNAVFAIETLLPPDVLLTAMLQAEKKHLRQRDIHWGPRTLDLDLLLYGERIINSPSLTLPHPHMNERSFVLVPLCEIAPTLCHPLSGRPFTTHLSTLTCGEHIKTIGRLPLPDNV